MQITLALGSYYQAGYSQNGQVHHTSHISCLYQFKEGQVNVLLSSQGFIWNDPAHCESFPGFSTSFSNTRGISRPNRGSRYAATPKGQKTCKFIVTYKNNPAFYKKSTRETLVILTFKSKRSSYLIQHRNYLSCLPIHTTL